MNQSPKKLKRTAGGFIDPDEISDEALKTQIVNFLQRGPCITRDLAEKVFKYAKFTYRENNRSKIKNRIWACTDELIEEGTLTNYTTKKTTKIMINK